MKTIGVQGMEKSLKGRNGNLLITKENERGFTDGSAEIR